MNRLAMLLPPALLLAACASDGANPGASGDGDWIVLFDGTSTDAWRGYRAETLPDGWSVVDGALTRTGPGGDIVTRERFASFVLEFEWRVGEGGNSGVFFHVTEENGATYESGPEYQVLDNEAHRDGLDPRTSAAANYALHAPGADHTRPAGEWNAGRIEVDGARVRHWLNGELVVEYELWSDEWKALVAASKFAQWPGYGLAREGHIALQDHGDRVSFRNVRVKRLG